MSDITYIEGDGIHIVVNGTRYTTRVYCDMRGNPFATARFPEPKQKGERCAYCNCKTKQDATHCTSCGAPT